MVGISLGKSKREQRRVCGLRDDSRGVSDVLGTLMALAMMALFLAGIAGLTTMGVDAVQDANTRESLDYRGEQLALSIELIDRQVQSSATTAAIGTTVDLPDTVGGEGYRVSVSAEANNLYSLTLVQNGEELSYTSEVGFRSVTDVQEATVQGGSIRIIRNSGGSEISLEEAGTN